MNRKTIPFSTDEKDQRCNYLCGPHLEPCVRKRAHRLPCVCESTAGGFLACADIVAFEGAVKISTYSTEDQGK